MSTDCSDSQTTEELIKSRSDYGDPVVNLGCAYDLKKTYRYTVSVNFAFVDKTPEDGAHDEAIEMCLTKIARIASGKRKADNYDDIMGYATLAKKLAGFED